MLHFLQLLQTKSHNKEGVGMFYRLQMLPAENRFYLYLFFLNERCYTNLSVQFTITVQYKAQICNCGLNIWSQLAFMLSSINILFCDAACQTYNVLTTVRFSVESECSPLLCVQTSDLSGCALPFPLLQVGQFGPYFVGQIYR